MGRVRVRSWGEFPAETRRGLLLFSFLSVSAPLRDLAFVVEWWSSCCTVARGGRLEEEEWGEFVFGHGVSFPQRR